jgi:hypothetical protein
MIMTPKEELDLLKARIYLCARHWEKAEAMVRNISHQGANLIAHLTTELRELIDDPPSGGEEPDEDLPF